MIDRRFFVGLSLAAITADPKRAQRYVTAVGEALRRVKAELSDGLTASVPAAPARRAR